MNHYRPLYRPMFGVRLPCKWDYVEAPRLEPHIAVRRNLPLSVHPYGIIETERPLTDEERRTFELMAV